MILNAIILNVILIKEIVLSFVARTVDTVNWATALATRVALLSNVDSTKATAKNVLLDVDQTASGTAFAIWNA